ncbi:putative transcription factor VLTF3 [Cafeteria roenbergensis virus]|uniref:Putative transcription factor VLTF3 n=1 Tax=Cafeteria roenbergensis virus (strain BV-PW1) TaxID=693272 RepID=E3T5B2_CROVB|nr:putative transcription factor VLTF3 [Cafeteria roenbergensis virus BV-PW1]ADO67375.1 putative transcription factor VLTF3 [Cafeteria roenbergensis virus BV-PW1]
MSDKNDFNYYKKNYKNLTLEKIHRHKMNEYKQNEDKLIKKNKQLEEMKLKNKDTSKIEQQIEELHYNGTTMEYFDKVGDLILDYYNEKNNVKTDETDMNIMDLFTKKDTSESNTNKLYSSYVKRLEGSNVDKYDGKNRIIKCDNCSIEKIYYPSEGSFICEECGDMTDMIIDDDFIIKDISCYHRSGRFKEWLNQFQAKENADIEDWVYLEIIKELNKKRITEYSALNRTIIREILRKLKLTKYYDNVTFIINKLNNIPAPKISHTLEKKLLFMFDMIEDIWAIVKPKNRKNMLSYPYILHKLCELLEEDKLLSSFPLLKSQDVLREQDIIWKRICNKLNWEFYSSFK